MRQLLSPQLSSLYPEPIIPIRARMEGRFYIELIDAKSQIVKKTWEFKNLIVDAGLDQPWVNSSLKDNLEYCAVGTDNTAPTVADVALGGELARVNNNGGVADSTGWDASGTFDYNFIIRSRLFTEGQANGNLTEIGWFRNNAGAPMWSRALILDDLGNPTVITKTSNEQLRVYYELRMWPPKTVVDNIIDINGTNYTFSTRVHDVDQSGWDFQFNRLGIYDSSQLAVYALESNVMPAIDATVAGGTQATATADMVAYVAGNKFREYRGQWDPAVANFASGVGSFLHAWDIGLDPNYRPLITVVNPKIPKQNTERLRITFRFAWDRV